MGSETALLPIASLLLVLTLSILITRVATVALTLTGLSRESARFQARSAFTGVGFTTSESEAVVAHPVRRRVLMLLMLLGNAGIVTVVSSLIVTFLRVQTTGSPLLAVLTLVLGVAALWWFAASRVVDRALSRVIGRALERYTRLDVRDYVSLLALDRDYCVTELEVQPEDWLANRRLEELKLREEGVSVLGIRRADGVYVGNPKGEAAVQPGDVLVLYGRQGVLAALDARRAGAEGDRAHQASVMEQRAERLRESEPSA